MPDTIKEAERLGAEIRHRDYGDERPVAYYWRYGAVGSIDQYSQWFSSDEDAARHFLGSREGADAKRRADRRQSEAAFERACGICADDC